MSPDLAIAFCHEGPVTELAPCPPPLPSFLLGDVLSLSCPLPASVSQRLSLCWVSLGSMCPFMSEVFTMQEFLVVFAPRHFRALPAPRPIGGSLEGALSMTKANLMVLPSKLTPSTSQKPGSYLQTLSHQPAPPCTNLSPPPLTGSSQGPRSWSPLLASSLLLPKCIFGVPGFCSFLNNRRALQSTLHFTTVPR